ncbi:hypothetical protein RhiTH_005891 [Rhizoctonia solani]
MLSRVNKFLRELFMDKRSALIWRSARENHLGLPTCPDEVSEPQYAAMLFTKRCSTCGGYAPREMNPILLIRLCGNCWLEELVDVNRVTDSSLLSVIGGPIPGQSYKWRSWCLYSEAREVKAKLNELNKAGDDEALRKWRSERHSLVEAKRRSAEPLSTWLRNRDRERAKNRDSLKALRQNEIESRLIEIGWEKGDLVCYDGWRRKQWKSMVHTTKRVTDKVWDNLLPRLLGHLEINRNQRLEREQKQRRSARLHAIHRWISEVRAVLPVYARAIPHDGDCLAIKGNFSVLENHASLHQAFPRASEVYTWPECTPLIENDMLHEQFLNEFEAKKTGLQQLIGEWRHRLETQLIAALPKGTLRPTLESSPFTMTIHTTEIVQPVDVLPGDIRKLLRADAIFTTSHIHDHSQVHWYPHSFDHFAGDITKMIFYDHACNISRALLSVLGIPDATYLHVKAMGKAFRCGRCPQATAPNYDWMDMVCHYLESIRLWASNARQRQVRSAKDFVYICTHDIDANNSSRPLVWIPAQDDLPTQPALFSWSWSKCMPCQRVGLGTRIPTQAIVEHVRYVHLIEEPELGIHYQH